MVLKQKSIQTLVTYHYICCGILFVCVCGGGGGFPPKIPCCLPLRIDGKGWGRLRNESESQTSCCSIFPLGEKQNSELTLPLVTAWPLWHLQLSLTKWVGLSRAHLFQFGYCLFAVDSRLVFKYKTHCLQERKYG